MSADSDFTPKGVTTGIKWSDLFDKLKNLAEDLKGFPEGQEMLKIWKEFVFANTYHADDEEEDDEEDEFDALTRDIRASKSCHDGPD
jgi:hypothetical protein